MWSLLTTFCSHNFVLIGTDKDQFMGMLLDETKIHCKNMGITTIILSESIEENVTAFKHFGFEEIWRTNDYICLMMNV